MSRCIIILAGAACLAACEQSIEERYAEAVCAKNFQCCSADEIAPDTSEDECRDGLEVGVATLIAGAEQDDDEGLVDFSEDNLERCLDAIEAAGCDAWPAVANEPPCSEVVVGKVEVGGSCFDDDECVSGRCSGTCQATVAEGADCTGADCGPDLYCDGSICQPRKAAGQVCTSFDECLSEDCVLVAGATESTCAGAPCYQGCRAPGGTALALAAALLLLVRRRRPGWRCP